ncbi:MAG: co-chaperone GroES [candidate division KSB1 bacterium]|nr:co-chaperone GroES [candidate division KSB1 bacterium]MDZ7336999.1 co-chaperone GroES [candidate division KSB1 bacterium]MDZ7385405.1 co-chaperone GroES [candidate division KSB1 bacterium]MDZ7391925.1 co-chaperone GroES [candidate division KSB1 bacterium]MDZ7414215.1 co-chaperone GroES [candidate division KSB1 bacterium]
MKIRPLGDKVLVQRLEEPAQRGPIVVPETAKERPQRGKVIEVGPGRVDKNGTRIPPAVKVGDTVLFAKWAGNEWTIEGKEYLFLSEDEILAVL